MDMIILAGGVGSRIASLTRNQIPKPMLTIAGRPFLALLLDWARTQNVTRAILAVGFRAHVIPDHFGDQYQDLPLTYVDEGEARLGTGGALKRACADLPPDRPVFAVNGDTHFPIPLPQLAQFHQDTGADLSLALTQIRNAGRYGRVLTDDSGRVTAFEEKRPHTDAQINGGIYCFKPRLLQAMAQTRFSLEHDVLEPNRVALFARAFPQPFRDIGCPEDFQAFIREQTP